MTESMVFLKADWVKLKNGRTGMLKWKLKLMNLLTYKKTNELSNRNSTIKLKTMKNSSSTFLSWNKMVTTSRSKKVDMSRFKDKISP